MYNKAWTHVVVGEEPHHNLFLFWFQSQGKYTIAASRLINPPISCAQDDLSKFKYNRKCAAEENGELNDPMGLSLLLLLLLVTSRQTL